MLNEAKDKFQPSTQNEIGDNRGGSDQERKQAALAWGLDENATWEEIDSAETSDFFHQEMIADHILDRERKERARKVGLPEQASWEDVVREEIARERIDRIDRSVKTIWEESTRQVNFVENAIGIPRNSGPEAIRSRKKELIKELGLPKDSSIYEVLEAYTKKNKTGAPGN